MRSLLLIPILLPLTLAVLLESEDLSKREIDAGNPSDLNIILFANNQCTGTNATYLAVKYETDTIPPFAVNSYSLSRDLVPLEQLDFSNSHSMVTYSGAAPSNTGVPVHQHNSFVNTMSQCSASVVSARALATPAPTVGQPQTVVEARAAAVTVSAKGKPNGKSAFKSMIHAQKTQQSPMEQQEACAGIGVPKAGMMKMRMRSDDGGDGDASEANRIDHREDFADEALAWADKERAMTRLMTRDDACAVWLYTAPGAGKMAGCHKMPPNIQASCFNFWHH